NNATSVTNFRLDDISVQITTETISTPGTISGEPNPIQNVSYNYTVGPSSSSLGHTVEYSFDWGDGILSAFSTSTTASHSWSTTGQKNIIVTARCQIHTSISNNNAPGQYVTVAPACTYALAPASGSNGSGAGSGTFNVIADSGCAW